MTGCTKSSASPRVRGTAFARLFFALAPDKPTRRRIIARRRALHLSGRPVAEDRLHATLVFLGSQPRERIDELKALAATVPFSATELRLNYVSGFNSAGVAWLGADPLPADLQAFRRRLVEALDRSHFPFDDKPWIFHVTLYRELRTPCAMMPVDPVPWAVREFVLMESVADHTRPHYRVCGRWPPRSPKRRRRL